VIRGGEGEACVGIKSLWTLDDFLAIKELIDKKRQCIPVVYLLLYFVA